MDFNRFTQPQKESVQTLGRPLLICAGAGSGKTFTLTQRITWALMPGSAGPGKAFLQDIGNALVITFTNKAASEIKERIRSNLRSEGMIDQALKVDSAWISTIHGACLRILREHALELGIDPQISLLSNTDSKDLLEDSIQKVLGSFQNISDPDEDALSQGQSHEGHVHLPKDFKVQHASKIREVIAIYGIKTVHDRLEEIIQKAQTMPNGIDAIQVGPKPPTPHQIAETMIETISAAQDQFSPKNKEIADGMLDDLQSFKNDVDAGYQKLEQMFHVKHFRAQRGKELVAQAKALQAQLEAETNLAIAQQHERIFLNLAQQIQDVYHQQLQSSGQMDMSDLIRFTLHAFKTHPDIAKSYIDRFQLIMVDEFQDTSQLQIDMISAIAKPDRSNLCTVGDSQQSIYRFQGADVSVYLAHKQRMTELAHHDPEQLDANYRSHADVLSFVRKVCGQKGYFPEQFLDLTAQRDESYVARSPKAYKASDPRIELVISDAPKMQQAIDAEAAHIARKFAHLHAQGHKASQMVVLLGTTTHLETYQNALRDVGLQCRAIGGSSFFQRPEVQLCQQILQAIANPLDSQNLLSVLSSDAIPVSSDDLLHLATKEDENQPYPIRQNIGFGMYLHIPDNCSELLKHALSLFKRAWKDIRHDSTSQVFRNVILESGWLIRLSQQGSTGQSVAANILKYIQLLEDAEKQNNFNVVRLASYMSEFADSEQTRLGGLSVTNDDAVRIMTVHSSKGLEFPIVAVASCYFSNEPKPTGRSRFTITSKQKSAWMTMYPPKSKAPAPGYADSEFVDNMEGKTPDQASNLSEFRYAIMNMNRSFDLAERRRLFYVAATRASEALIVSMAHRITKNNTYKDVQGTIIDAFWPDGHIPESSCEIEYHDSVDKQDHTITFTHLISDEDNNIKGETLPEPENSTMPESSITANSGIGQDRSLSLIGQEEVQIDIPDIQKPKKPYFVPEVKDSGFFSFSSIAPAAESTGETSEDNHDTENEKNADQAPVIHEADAEVDESEIEENPARNMDPATLFGTALHKCCEWAAYQRHIPSSEEYMTHLNAIRTTYQISDTDRLHNAFKTWINSDICTKAFAYEIHRPETPFTIQIDDHILEGSIDLLCANRTDNGTPDLSHALIIDYKTGGSADESIEKLTNKHCLQGQCYAYAAMMYGFRHVDVRFVRVEQANAQGQPQIVPFAYTADEKDDLLETITRQEAKAREAK